MAGQGLSGSQADAVRTGPGGANRREELRAVSPGDSGTHNITDVDRLLSTQEKNLTQRFEAREAKIIQQLESMVEGVADKVASRLNRRISITGPSASACGASRCTATGSTPSGGFTKKKGLSSPDAPQVRKVCVENRRGVIPLLQWAQLITVASFGKRFPAAEHWLEGDVRCKLSGDIETVCAVSGIQAVMFVVGQGEKKAKLRTHEGAAWSLWFRKSVLSMILYAKNNVLTGNAPVSVNGTTAEIAEEDDYSAPPWLVSLDSPEKATNYVHQIFDKVELKSQRSTASASVEDDVTSVAKRQKMNRDDPEYKLCEYAIKNIRSVLMSWMNYRRADARAYLYKEVMFLVEEIGKFDSVQSAKEAGFEIVLNPDHEDLEFGEGVWDIPNASSESMRKARSKGTQIAYGKLDDENVKSLEQLEKKYTGLTVTLKYKSRVQREGIAASISNSPGDDENIYWRTERPLCLHSLATGFLMELFKVGDSRFVLSCSVHSLKAIHVMAIGMRGLLRRFLGGRPTAVENKALGEVTHSEGFPGGWVSLMMGLKGSDDGKDRTRREKLRDARFTVGWEWYCKELKKLEMEEERRRAEAEMSEGDVSDVNAIVSNAADSLAWNPLEW